MESEASIASVAAASTDRAVGVNSVEELWVLDFEVSVTGLSYHISIDSLYKNTRSHLV